MNSIIYLLQVSACTGVFYLFYYLFLNKLTFFVTNRWYLLITVVLSFVIPLIRIQLDQPHVYTGVVQQVVYTYTSQQAVTPAVVHPVVAQPVAAIHWGAVLKVAYWGAVLGLTIHLIITLIAFFKRLKGRRIAKLGNVHILSGDQKITNGSFLNYIFLNDEELSVDEMQQIIAHEMLHVRLYHSADRILIKLAQIILWFNPFIYLYARSVEENHEFEVDRAIARDTDKQNYANLLLHLSVSGQGMLYHNFSKVPLKKRITMLFNKPSANMKKIVYILIIPVVLISCLAFAGLKSNTKENTKLLTIRHKELKTPAEMAIDVVHISAPTGRWRWTDAAVPRNTKVGFFVDRDFYTEEQFLNLPSEKQAVILKTEMPMFFQAARFDVLKKQGYNVNLPGYGGAFIISVKKPFPDYFFSDKKTIKSIDDAKDKIIYTRTTIKGKGGKVYDMAKLQDAGGSYAKTEVPHNADIGFFIDKDFYTEEEFKSLPEDREQEIAKATIVGATEKSAFGDLIKQGYQTDWDKYTVVFHIYLKTKPVGYTPAKQRLAEQKVSAATQTNTQVPVDTGKSFTTITTKGQTSFFKRMHYKNSNGTSHDKVTFTLSDGSAGADLGSEEKLGVFIDHKFYDEAAILKLSNEVTSKLTYDTTRNGFKGYNLPKEAYAIPFKFITKKAAAAGQKTGDLKGSNIPGEKNGDKVSAASIWSGNNGLVVNSANSAKRISATATDSSYFDKANQVTYLYGKANVTLNGTNIMADYIRIDEARNNVFAKGNFDPKTKRYAKANVSVTTSNGKNYIADSITYNKDKGIFLWKGDGYVYVPINGK